MKNEKEIAYIVDVLYANRPPRYYSDYAPTLRSGRWQLLVINNEEKRDKTKRDD